MNSVAVPALINDEFIKKGSFLKLQNGDPQAYVGGFSIVFPVEVNGTKWAFRCWHTTIDEAMNRIRKLSNELKNAKLNYLLDYIYIESGITINGKSYPTTRMRWIDGITIKDYICQNRNSKDLLIALADNFLKMAQALHAQSLAHGDLQHGNILVDKNHKLFLVDYDSFYCPLLKGEADIVTGLADYQHPSRVNNKYMSEKMDYFSELIIYLSILAIADCPLLVEKYQVEDADRLLFSKDDYMDIKSSNIYKDIYKLGKKFQDLLSILTEYLVFNDIDKLSPFDKVLLEDKITLSASATRVARNSQTIEIKWNVPFKAKVCLKKLKPKEIDLKKRENKGVFSSALKEDSTFQLLVETNGYLITKEISITVFDECKIEFSADKYFVFPTIPVKLSWKVKNAQKVWLDNEEVSPSGTRIVEPKEAITYILQAEDELGKKEKRVEIGILPIPQVKSLFVPTPNIVNNLSLTIKQPRYHANVSFPNITIGMIDTEIPKVPSFKDMGLNVELSPPIPEFSLTRLIQLLKNKFYHISKISNGIKKYYQQYRRKN